MRGTGHSQDTTAQSAATMVSQWHLALGLLRMELLPASILMEITGTASLAQG